MASWTWGEYTELLALMQPDPAGEAEHLDPLDRSERSGEPVDDELPTTRRAWTRGNSQPGPCMDCGRHQDQRYTGRCSRCYKRLRTQERNQ